MGTEDDEPKAVKLNLQSVARRIRYICESTNMNAVVALDFLAGCPVAVFVTGVFTNSVTFGKIEVWGTRAPGAKPKLKANM